ncbi:glutathione S-transferase C-terminal-like protein [Atractiella rhizophila]|nr:glutathione S-transferase C-terminal-like protein [Atractiella rhizophila]
MSNPDITLYANAAGPNPWKVAVVLESLGIKYERIMLDTYTKGEHKAPEYTRVNPNGRLPAIVDHRNDDFVLWESNAILLYLVDRYDKERRISAATPEEKAVELQYLFFQASGQGPYFGQYVWFARHHHEKLPSAIERYEAEANRVLSVIEDILSKQEWIGGHRCTIADLAFVTWNLVTLGGFIGVPGLTFTPSKDLPKVREWHRKMLEMEPVKKTLALRDQLFIEFLENLKKGNATH